MKYLIIVCSFYLIACSVNKDAHDMNDRLAIVDHRVGETTEEVKKTNLELGKISMNSEKTYAIIEELLKKLPKDSSGAIDLSQKDEKELKEIAKETQSIVKAMANNKETTVTKEITAPEIAPPAPNIPARKQALIYRIAAYFKQLFKDKDENATANP